jgi:hypothetical protein
MGRAASNFTATSERPSVSKGKFLWGQQCRKLLWVAYNAKDRIPESDAAQQAIFDQGHEVGALAKSLYAGGIEVSADVTDFDQVLQRSLEARSIMHSLPTGAAIQGRTFCTGCAAASATREVSLFTTPTLRWVCSPRWPTPFLNTRSGLRR